MSRRNLVLVVVAAVAAIVVGVAALVLRPDDSGSPESATSSSIAPTSTSTTALVGSPGAAGVGDPYFPELGNGGYDVISYDLELVWDADAGRLSGSTTIVAEATQDLSRFNLDLSGLEVLEVLVRRQPATFVREGRELVVTPATAIAEGSSFTTEIRYEGRPEPIRIGTDLFGSGWQIDGREAYVASEPAGAATFFPVNDHPTDKATYSFNVTAPADQVVAANGMLVGEPVAGPDGTLTWTYETDDQMASYLVQVAIGDFELWNAGGPDLVYVRHALHRSFAEQAKVTLERTGEMIEVLSDVFGPYPFDVYGVVAVDEPLGFALETQTLTLIGSDVVANGRASDDLLVHELAHQWVGNAVSPATWRDIWLNEGFATYAEWIFLERTGGPTAAESARRYHRLGQDVIDDPPGEPGSEELFAPSVYLRGGMTLQALRETIGDDAFFTLLRRWVSDNEDKTASTEDLVKLAEQISGKDLDQLFNDWLYAKGAPSLG
ncbi:MAG TPA: M1 family metallopeptidase [Acidimicrobiales bacterium]